MHGLNPHTRVGTKLRKGLSPVIESVAATVKVHNSLAFGMENDSKSEETTSEKMVDCRLYRVVYDQVVARDGPAMTRGVMEMFFRGNFVAAEEMPDSPWVRVVAPDGYMGGKIGTKFDHHKKAAYMLTDGSQRGLGTLLEPTKMLVRLAEDSEDTSEDVEPRSVPSKGRVGELEARGALMLRDILNDRK